MLLFLVGFLVEFVIRLGCVTPVIHGDCFQVIEVDGVNSTERTSFAFLVLLNCMGHGCRV